MNATFKEKDALKGKIEQANLLVLDKKPAAIVDRSHDSPVPKTKVSSKVNDRKPHSKKPKTKSKVDDSKSKSKKPKTKQGRVFSLKKLLSKLTQ